MSQGFKASAQIKLVIWDMDDTFWEGTLSEGEIKLIDRNIEIVKTLTDRGILSSIASKNDVEPVKAALEKAGVWDYFVFPHINWNSKGGSIANIIEQANLRPDNVLFIDDNSMNIEEMRFRFPTLMTAYPWDVLDVLLDLPEAKGKDDRAHSRLKQYKQLEKKVADMAQTPLSNEDFLRQSDVRLRFEFDVEKHFDRIVELVNRSNQLNYTKVRIETPEALAAFKDNLKRHDIISGAIFASDRYGNHGLIGFYMQQKNERVNRLLHYVWSCRMMNSGLEQYVYERLGEPAIEVVQPVSNPIKVFDKVDWVRELTSEDDEGTSAQEQHRLLLVGSCDLAAVSSYCSPNRAEYVNGVKNGIMTRYDDFGFILGDEKKVETSKTLDKLPTWSKADFKAFRQDLTSSDILIISLSAAMKGAHMLTEDEVVVRVHPEGLGIFIDENPLADFLKGVNYYALSAEQTAALLNKCLNYIDASASKAKYKFLLGANTRDVDGKLSRENYELLTRYNEICQKFCADNGDWHFVSINDVVAKEKLLDDRHYTRTGYFDIANYINAQVKAQDAAAEKAAAARTVAEVDIGAYVRTGRKLSRVNLFGAKSGAMAHLKRGVKLLPFARQVHKALVKPKQDPLVAQN